MIDGAPGPAQGASALPVGMLSPHVTRVPTPLSRLSALGVADMRRQLESRIAPGAGWQPCQVDNLGHDPGRWPAALVRPAALVQAWLAEARAGQRLRECWNAPVARLQAVDGGAGSGGWQALAADGRVLAEAPVAVVASAYDSQALLAATAQLDSEALPLHPVQGQMSLAALEGEPLAPLPQRDNGVFVPCYEDSGLPPLWPARVWAMGSTYERGQTSCALSEAAHGRNAQRLEAMNPDAAQRLRTALEQDLLLGWAQVRCASLDRLPLMGAVPDLAALRSLVTARGHQRSRIRLSDVPRLAGLYTLSALGSRGLTLAHWCATQLAVLIDGQASDLPESDADLLAALDPARFAWKRSRRQPQSPVPITVLPA